MNSADMIALYGAALATLLAVTQCASAWRRRTRVRIEAHLEHQTTDAVGTPVILGRGGDTRTEYIAIRLTARNVGGRPVQVMGVLIESLDLESATFHTRQITPEAVLPVVLDPGSATEMVIQKEHLDLLESCTFLGIVDGTGRRHGVPRDQATQLVRQSWVLPTRVSVFQRKGKPEERIVAYQAMDPARLASRRATSRYWRRSIKPLAVRAHPLLETLLDGGQPIVRVAAPLNEPRRDQPRSVDASAPVDGSKLPASSESATGAP